MTENRECPKSVDGKHVWTMKNKFLDKCNVCAKEKRIFTLK